MAFKVLLNAAVVVSAVLLTVLPMGPPSQGRAASRAPPQPEIVTWEDGMAEQVSGRRGGEREGERRKGGKKMEEGERGTREERKGGRASAAAKPAH